MPVLLLRVTGEPHAFVPLRRAMSLLESGKAYLIEAHEIPVRSAGGRVFQRPSVLSLTRYIHLPRYRIRWSKRDVLARDNHTWRTAASPPTRWITFTRNTCAGRKGVTPTRGKTRWPPVSHASGARVAALCKSRVWPFERALCQPHRANTHPALASAPAFTHKKTPE